jgi:hypothetical protein
MDLDEVDIKPPALHQRKLLNPNAIAFPQVPDTPKSCMKPMPVHPMKLDYCRVCTCALLLVLGSAMVYYTVVTYYQYIYPWVAMMNFFRQGLGFSIPTEKQSGIPESSAELLRVLESSGANIVILGKDEIDRLLAYFTLLQKTPA